MSRGHTFGRCSGGSDLPLGALNESLAIHLWWHADTFQICLACGGLVCLIDRSLKLECFWFGGTRGISPLNS